jgi:hypothetical protein
VDLRDPFINSTRRTDIMRNQLVFSLLAATVAGTAFAAPAASQEPQRAPQASAPTCASATYKLKAGELDGVPGEFALSDGRRLTVTHAYGKLFARVDGARTEIVAVAPKRFVSRDDKLQLEFDQVPFANQVKVVLDVAG